MGIALLTNQEALQALSATGADGSAKPAGFSAQIAPYATAYVALTGGNTLHIVPKGPTGDVTVTITGHSADGTALPVVTITYTISAPPVAQATQIVAADPTIKGQDITTPPDPGTDTVTGNL